MGRSSRYTHFHTGEFVERHGKQEKVLICPAEPLWLNEGSQVRAQVNCPKCCLILAERDLAQYNEANPDKKLALEKTAPEDNIGYDARFCYRAMYAGEHVGYVIFAGAYARGRWHLTQLAFDKREGVLTKGKGYVAPAKDALRIGGYIDRDELPSEDLKKSVRRFGHNRDGIPFPSKIDALLMVPHLVGNDTNKAVLYSVASLKRTQEENARWRENFNREMAEAEAAEAALLNEALEGLRELRDDRTDITNFQRNAVIYAITKLSTKEKE